MQGDHQEKVTVNGTDKQPRIEQGATGAPKASFLQRLAEEALDNGRPVLILPIDGAGPERDEHSDPPGEDCPHDLRLPKNTTVIFSGAGGSSCAPSEVSESLQEDLAPGGRASRVRRRLSGEDVKHPGTPEPDSRYWNPLAGSDAEEATILRHSLYDSCGLHFGQVENLRKSGGEA